MAQLKSAAAEYRRAAHFKQKLGLAEQQVTALRNELRTSRAHGYVEGSAAMMAGVTAALDDDILSLWLSARMMSCRTRKPPFHLSDDKAAMVRAEVADLLRRSGIKSVRVEEIEL